MLQTSSSQTCKSLLAVSCGRVTRGQRQTIIPYYYFSHGHDEIFHSCFPTYTQLLGPLLLPQSSEWFSPIQFFICKMKVTVFPWGKAMQCFLSGSHCFLRKYILVQEMRRPNISFLSETQTPRSYYHPSTSQLLLNTCTQSKYAHE